MNKEIAILILLIFLKIANFFLSFSLAIILHLVVLFHMY